MLKKTILVFLIGLAFFSGILLSSQTFASSSSIPAWIKNTAKFWVNGQISDDEFIAALQYLVKERILVIPEAKPTTQKIQEPVKDIPVKDPTLITKRIDGVEVQNFIDEWRKFMKTFNNEQLNDRIYRSSSVSNFLLIIVSNSKWSGSMMDGSSIVSPSGEVSAVIPYNCTKDSDYYFVSLGSYAYDSANNQLSVVLVKNGVIIDGGVAYGSFAMVSLEGNCSNPDYVENMESYRKQSGG